LAVPTATPPDTKALRERIREDTPYWAEKFGKIVNKSRQLVPFVYKPGQLAFDQRLEAQRADGKPMRMIVLKARKVGISSATQAKLIHRCTLREHYEAVVVAQDKGTGEKLYNIGERLYTKLPSDPELKPALGRHRRSQYLHFVGESHWTQGESFPDSSYFVDTAGEFQSGRGATPTAVHASEVAFWPQVMTKLTALKNAVPREAETMFVIESTANGFNEFKDIWDDAEAGRSSYDAFFWPWWKEEEYRLDFITETERERFVVGDPDNPYAEEEPDLVKNLGLTLEQLNWRRQTIADECNGDVRTFHQEYPSTPEEAFVSTGKKVFDAYRVAQLIKQVELTNPKKPDAANPGPLLGDLVAAEERTQVTRSGGTIEVPGKALWTPRMRGVVNPTAPWRLWLPTDDLGAPRIEGDFIVFVDPSGGEMENTDEPDYHAIQVVDHLTGDQVAEYRSRIDPDLIALQALLAALLFNQAYIGVERTGGWGLPILRLLYFDYHYPHVYRSKRVGSSNEKTEQRLGFSTDVRTKPILVAGMQELIRIEKSGIKSRALANEVRTYTQTDSGKLQAESGKYDDLLMAFMGAQQLMRELPRKGLLDGGSAPAGFVAGSGVGAYDNRYS
jgi:hypothetical protein